tara:strand:- start:17274 stop:17462 length:189 start_codon:yes stop_codon:yes gene_type:complete
MTNEEKGQAYDNCIRESDVLQRVNSKIKSEYAGNIPEDQQLIINSNNTRIEQLVKILENLFE